jgi:hypothetical protein
MSIFKKRHKNIKGLHAKREVPKSEHSRGTLLSDLVQRRLSAKKPKIELAGVVVERNYWALATILLSVALVICLVSLYVQTNRYENNIRTLMIKLYPNGTYDVDRVNFKGMPNYFLSTLNSLITQYIERRYSKHSDTITADYGFAYQFMSPEMRNQFMNDYHAAEKAKQFQTCTDCAQTTVKVGPIQHYEDDQTILHAKPAHEYRSTVFVTVSKHTKDGMFISRDKKIITLVWRIRSLKELNNDISSVRADPIGLVIVRASMRDDPSNSGFNKKS